MSGTVKPTRPLFTLHVNVDGVAHAVPVYEGSIPNEVAAQFVASVGLAGTPDADAMVAGIVQAIVDKYTLLFPTTELVLELRVDLDDRIVPLPVYVGDSPADAVDRFCSVYNLTALAVHADVRAALLRVVATAVTPPRIITFKINANGAALSFSYNTATDLNDAVNGFLRDNALDTLENADDLAAQMVNVVALELEMGSGPATLGAPLVTVAVELEESGAVVPLVVHANHTVLGAVDDFITAHKLPKRYSAALSQVGRLK